MRDNKSRKAANIAFISTCYSLSYDIANVVIINLRLFVVELRDLLHFLLENNV